MQIGMGKRRRETDAANDVLLLLGCRREYKAGATRQAVTPPPKILLRPAHAFQSLCSWLLSHLKNLLERAQPCKVQAESEIGVSIASVGDRHTSKDYLPLKAWSLHFLPQKPAWDLGALQYLSSSGWDVPRDQ